MTTYFTIDTNVFLHFELFTEVDWSDLLGEEDLTLLLTKTVIRELDDKKNHPDKVLSSKAKRALGKIDHCIDVETFSNHKKTFAVEVVRKVPPAELYATWDLSETAADDRILAEVLQLKVVHPEKRFVMVSSDTGMKVKTKWLDIEFFRMPESFRQEHKDARDKEHEATKRELARLQSAMPKLKVRFADESERLTIAGRREALPTEAELVALVHQEFEYHEAVLSKYAGPRQMMGSLRAFMEPDIEAYKRDWALYSAAHLEYLRKERDYRDAVRRIFKLQFRLDNHAGTKPAEYTKVILQAPSGMRFIDSDDLQMPVRPTPPKRPEPQTAFDRAQASERVPVVVRRDTLRDTLAQVPDIGAAIRKAQTANWSIQGNRATIEPGALPNRDHRNLPVLYLEIEKGAEVNSFHVDAVAEAGLPDPFLDELHVILTDAPAEDE